MNPGIANGMPALPASPGPASIEFSFAGTSTEENYTSDIPTIRMPYLADVPVVHASSAVKRIVALAYFLVWAWEEHKRAARLRQVDETHQIVLFVAFIASHVQCSSCSSRHIALRRLL